MRIAQFSAGAELLFGIVEGLPGNEEITLTITRRAELEHGLDSVVAGLLEPAKQLKQGLLVTRLSPELFNVSLSEKVPYGTTVENVSW
jgi:hypothetical protein